MLNKLATKRLLAGLIDIIIMIAIDKIVLISGTSFTAAAPLYYFMSLFKYNTTVGGVLLNIRIANIDGNDLTKAKKLLRAFIFVLAFFAVSLSQLIDGTNLWPLVILIVIALPMFFTKKSVSLIDFFSRSRVIKDANNTYEKYKKENALIFASAIILILSFFAFLFIRTNNCYDWAQKREFQTVIQKCEKITKISRDSGMHYNLGLAYRFTKQHEKALNTIKKAKLLGNKNADFATASIYIDKKEYDVAIEIASSNLNDIKMLSVLAIAHAMKASGSNSFDELINSYAYSKAIIHKSKDLSEAEIKSDPDISMMVDTSYKFIDHTEKNFKPSQKKQADKRFEEVMKKMTSN